MLIKQGSSAHANSNVLKSRYTVFLSYSLKEGIRGYQGIEGPICAGGVFYRLDFHGFMYLTSSFGSVFTAFTFIFMFL